MADKKYERNVLAGDRKEKVDFKKIDQDARMSEFLKYSKPMLSSDGKNYVAGSMSGEIPFIDGGRYSVNGSASRGRGGNISQASAFLPMFGGELGVRYNKDGARRVGTNSRGPTYSYPQDEIGVKYKYKF